MMLTPSTLNRVPTVSMPYVEEQARILAHRMSRRPLMLDIFSSNRWLFQQDFKYRQQQVKKLQRSIPVSQPGCNLTFRPVAFHGWRKLAWYVVGILDNVSHVWRIAA